MCVQFLEMFFGCWMVDFSHNKNERERERASEPLENPIDNSMEHCTHGFDSAVSGALPIVGWVLGLLGFWEGSQGD